MMTRQHPRSSGPVPAALSPIKLPATTSDVPRHEILVALPAMTLPGAVPGEGLPWPSFVAPPIKSELPWLTNPLARLPIAIMPVTSVPIKLPWTRVAVGPGDDHETVDVGGDDVACSLPSAPPIVLPEADDSFATPSPLPSADLRRRSGR